MNKRWPPLPAVFTVGTLSLALCTWIFMAQGELRWQAALGSLLLWTFLCWSGVCCSSLVLREEGAIDPVLSTVLGFYSLSMLLFLGTVVFRLDILVSFSLCVIVSLLLAYRTRKRRPFRRLDLPRPAIFAVLLAVVFTTYWSRQNLAGLDVTETTVTSVPWLDAFYHSVYISHFARGAGKVLATDPLLATARLPVYHYAAYIIPSLVVRCTDTPAYIGTVAVFSPVGLLLTGLTAYSFARALCGPLAGLLAVVLCLGLPDPTFYIVERRWLSYFFFQTIAANGAMGAALMLMAWTFCLRGAREEKRQYTYAGLAAALSVVCFKSQIFLGYSFGVLLFSALTFPRAGFRARLALGALATGAFVVSAAKILPAIPRAPTLQLATIAGPENLKMALQGFEPCRQCIDQLASDSIRFLPLAGLTLLALVFGLLIPLALLFAGSHRVRVALSNRGMWFLWTAALNYLVVALGLALNAGHGDRFELVHKTFVWPYLAICAWCSCAIAAWLLTLNVTTRRIAFVAVLPLLLVGLGIKVYECAGRLQTEAIFSGHTYNQIDRGAFDAAIFLRNNSPKNAIVQPAVVNRRLMLMFQSLMDRNTYVGYVQHGPIATQQTDHAYKQVSSMLAARTVDELRVLARKNHIDYLVLYPRQRTRWAKALTPCFQSGAYRVFRL